MGNHNNKILLFFLFLFLLLLLHNTFNISGFFLVRIGLDDQNEWWVHPFQNSVCLQCHNNDNDDDDDNFPSSEKPDDPRFFFDLKLKFNIKKINGKKTSTMMIMIIQYLWHMSVMSFFFGNAGIAIIIIIIISIANELFNLHIFFWWFFLVFFVSIFIF